MRRIAAMILAAVVACICLVSCGGKDPVGKWELEEMSSGGVTMKDKFAGIPVAIMFQFEFSSDGTGKMKQNESGTDAEQRTFKWEQDGDKIILTTEEKEDNRMELTWDGDMLTSSFTDEESGATTSIKVKKVDEFTEFDPSDIDVGDFLNGLADMAND